MDKRLDGLRERLLRMGGLAESILEKALQSLADRDAELAAQVKEDDLAIDRLDVEIDQAVLELIALQAPVADDLRQALAIKVAAVDLERVGDLARDIADSTVALLERPLVQPPAAFADLVEESRRSLSAALTAFADADADKARWVLQSDDRIDDDEALVIRDRAAFDFGAIQRGYASSTFALCPPGHTGVRKGVFDALACGAPIGLGLRAIWSCH